MLNIINRNKEFLINNSLNDVNKKLVDKIVRKLKKEKLVTITGLKGVGKTNIISYIVKNSNLKDNFLYINKSLDLNNKIRDEKSLNKLLKCFVENFGKPKIIILEDLALTRNIKSFINFLYKQNYTIVIIGNNISIGNKPEIEINSNRDYEFKLIKNEEEYLEKLKTKDIIFEEIIKSYSLKNTQLYNYTISFLSNFNKNVSIREINRKLNENIKISLVTMMEYLKYSINAKILKQVYAFDFKKNKQINTKTKYYFTNTDLRNSLYNFELEEDILKENFLYNELYKSGYKINSGVNGSYDFNFYGSKVIQKENNNSYKIDTIFIDFCKSNDKKELKKQINKLLKVPEIPYEEVNKNDSFIQSFSKYIVLENYNKIGIKKLNYENLRIISLNELLEII